MTAEQALSLIHSHQLICVPLPNTGKYRVGKLREWWKCIGVFILDLEWKGVDGTSIPDAVANWLMENP